MQMDEDAAPSLLTASTEAEGYHTPLDNAAGVGGGGGAMQIEGEAFVLGKARAAAAAALGFFSGRPEGAQGQV